jgi:hypothetical protein
MVTDENGELWLKDRLRIGENIEIGLLTDRLRGDSKTVYEVFHAEADGADENAKFVVYSDGLLEARGGIFRGTIYAEGGLIGSKTIGDVENVVEGYGDLVNITDTLRGLTCSSELGNVFKVGQDASKADPAVLNFSAKATGIEVKLSEC